MTGSRHSKLDYYFDLAALVATRSKDSTKVGAVLIGPSGEIRATGYNGPPIGVLDLPERFERPAKYLFANHAEANVIAFCARNGTAIEGCDLYVTHFPCSACARLIIQSGIKRVWYRSGEAAMLTPTETGASMAMLNEANVQFRGHR